MVDFLYGQSGDPGGTEAGAGVSTLLRIPETKGNLSAKIANLLPELAGEPRRDYNSSKD